MSLMFPKNRRAKSKTYRQQARDKDCTLHLNGCRWGETVGAHPRLFAMSGFGHKPSDIFLIFACQHCHDVLDGRIPGEWGFEDVLRGLMKTQDIMYNNGWISLRGDENEAFGDITNRIGGR